MIKTRSDWYSNNFVLYNIINQLKHRYLSVGKKNKKDPKKRMLTRYYMGYSLDLLKDSLERNGVLHDPSAKIYYDLATWKNSENITPIFSFNNDKRTEQKKKFTGTPGKNNGEYITLMKSYDFCIDIDSKDLMKAHKEAKIIKGIFDKYKICYQLRFSGSHGFHFCIDAKYITTRIKPINRPALFGKIVENLSRDERLSTPDMSIYDARRVLKLAYSLCNNDGTEYVALPLDNRQFEFWKYEDMRMSEVAKPYKVKLFKRGLLERDHGLSEQQLKRNVSKFIKEYK